MSQNAITWRDSVSGAARGSLTLDARATATYDRSSCQLKIVRDERTLRLYGDKVGALDSWCAKLQSIMGVAVTRVSSSPPTSRYKGVVASAHS
mmetsp:Transcript_9479/g.21118  ORF Transcript_9479/g.21118 Transcript_9479/m.21118 type:complete len:93 (+) Transcript_9479:2-280(+)